MPINDLTSVTDGSLLFNNFTCTETLTGGATSGICDSNPLGSPLGSGLFYSGFFASASGPNSRADVTVGYTITDTDPVSAIRQVGLLFNANVTGTDNGDIETTIIHRVYDENNNMVASISVDALSGDFADPPFEMGDIPLDGLYQTLRVETQIILDTNTSDASISLSLINQEYEQSAVAVIGDRVWFDSDRDGVQDAGEAGAAGAQVELLNGDGNVIDTTTTDANGNYKFLVDVAGDYQLRFTAPDGQDFTLKDSSGNDLTDSDVDAATGLTDVFSVNLGDENLSFDAGLVDEPAEVGSISGRYFCDDNRDGLEQDADSGVSGKFVFLLNAAGTAPAVDADGNGVAPAITDANGNYRFDNLAEGNYSVQFQDSAPEGKDFVEQDKGDDDTIDSDANPLTGLTGPVSVIGGQETTDVDAGVVAPLAASINIEKEICNDNGAHAVTGQAIGQVGTVEVLQDTVEEWVRVEFDESITDAVVVATVNTTNDGDQVSVRVRNIDETGFEMRIEEWAGNDGVHDTAETVSWMAVSAGEHTLADGRTIVAGQDKVTGSYQTFDLNGHDFGADAPVVLAQATTTNDASAVAVRLRNVDGGSFQARVQSDEADGKRHGAETVSWIAMDAGTSDGLLVGATGDNVRHKKKEIDLSGANLDSDLAFLATMQSADGGDTATVRGAGLSSDVAHVFVEEETSKNTEVRHTTENVGYAALNSGLLFASGAGANAADHDCEDADTVADAATLTPGQQFTYLFSVTNNGEADLTNVQVTDDNATPGNGGDDFAPVPVEEGGFNIGDTNQDGILNPGETWIYEQEAIAKVGTIINTAIVTATSTDDGTTVTDDDPAVYVVEDPGTAAMAGRVFCDENDNDVEDAGEPGIGGVTVELLDTSGAVIATQATDVNGDYEFTGLDAGTYSVRFPTVVDGKILVDANDPNNNGDDTNDSDADQGTGTTAPVTLGIGERSDDNDAGVEDPGTASVGNLVFLDNNGNGVFDAGDGVVAGATVELLDENGNVAATQVTGADGEYCFEGLDAGVYSVRFTAPAGQSLGFTTEGGAADDAVNNDSDANVATGETGQFDLSIGEEEKDIDAGLVVVDPGTAEIRGTYFCDENDNDVRDAGEPGIAGAVVTLLSASGAVVATTTTGADGNYVFGDLPAGTYSLRFAADADGKTFVDQDDPNGNGDDTNDSDVDASGETGDITVGIGDTSDNNDAGVEDPGTAAMAGRVFCDENDNDVEDAGEPGIGGVTVELLDTSGAVIATQATDVNGDYEFTGLDAGTYSVRFPTVVDGKILVDANDPNNNGDDTNDSDADQGTGTTAPVTLGIGERSDDNDAGVEDPGTASVGNLVFLDNNGNGVFDAGDGVVAGATVELLDENGNVAATQVTGADGEYCFEGLDAGVYSVRFTAPAGQSLGFTTEGGAADDAVNNDSDANVATGETGQFDLSIGEEEKDIDAGLVVVDPGTAEIRGTYFCDENDNDVRDAGEPGIAGAVVTLLSASGAVVATTTTGADGNYVFGDLPAGTYSLRFAADADGKTFVDQDDPNGNGDDTNDSDVDASGETGDITVGIGDTSDNNDAGVEDPGTAAMAGRVFCDENDNDVEDAGEPGIGGVTVELLDTSGAVIATQATDVNGDYEFTGLDAGTYSVRFPTVVDGKILVDANDPNNNGDDTNDSDADQGTGTTAPVTLGIGERSDDNDAGVEDPGTASVGNLVFLDNNGNGVFDAGDGVVAGATVELLDENGNVAATQVTGADGEYCFEGLDAGVYSVRFTAPAGQSLGFTTEGGAADDAVNNDSDANVATGETGQFDLSIGEEEKDIDAGLVQIGKHICAEIKNLNYDGTPSWRNWSFESWDGPMAVILDKPVAEDTTFVVDTTGTIQISNDLQANHANGRWTPTATVTVLAGETISDPFKMGHSVNTINDYGQIISGGSFYVKSVSGNNVDTIEIKPPLQWDIWGANTPIVFDLDGSGVIEVTGETTSFDKNDVNELGDTVEFDIDGDGELETIEWLAGDGDAFLFDNRDGNAINDMNGSRLFGDADGHANGYEKLEEFDTDGDGQLTGKELEGLQLWQDNGDAIMTEDEIVFLTDIGITSISTEMELVIDDEGRELMQSHATLEDGTTILTEDVWFMGG